MDDGVDLRRRAPGRRVLGALAILGALGFLMLVMVQAMAFFAPPQPLKHLIGPATKSAPVVNPPPLVNPELPVPPEPPKKPPRLLLPATKAGILGPLKVTPPAAQPQVTPPPRP